MTGEELRARLMAEAERVIDDMLAKKSAPDQITMRDIEQLALESGWDFREQVVKHLTQTSVGSETETVRCPTCGGVMQRRGKRAKQVVSEAGEVRLERQYYYCEGCGRGSFPPG